MRRRRRLREFLLARWMTSNSSRERPGADRDAGQRRLGQVRGHLGLLPQALVEALQQRAAAGEHDAAVHDVGRELGRRAVERLLDRVDDLRQRLLERLADLLAGEHHGLGQARDHVAPADLGLDLLLHRVGGADLELDLLGGLLADQQLVLALGVVDDRLVELVAADADRLRDDDPAERDHGDLAGAAADVDDHRAGRLADRQARRRSRRPSAPRSGRPGARRPTGTPPRPRASRRRSRPRARRRRRAGAPSGSGAPSG